MRTAALALLCLAAPAFAQSAARTDVFPYAHQSHDFENGLRLITVPTDHPGVVSVYVVVSVGSRDEIQEGRSGFAHFFEHMMFRGSKNFSSAEQARLFKAAGADRNAYTTDDYTCYHTTFSTADLEQVLQLEADRFRFLEYSEPDFRTEALAILGEYNTSSASPVRRMYEQTREVAFREHTYRHTTLGFLRDIRKMPQLFDYSREFFAQHYRPDNTTVLVVGDVQPAATRALVEKYWGGWRAATAERWAPPQPEPEQTEPLTCHVKWPAPTSPWVMVSFKGPAFSTTSKDMAVLDVIANSAFSPNSDVYKKLYVREGLVDYFGTDFGDHHDPYLVSILARVKRPEDVARVEQEILAACAGAIRDGIADAELARTKANLRYGFAAGLDSPDGIAGLLAGYVGRTRSVNAVNAVYRLYEQVTVDDVKAMAAKYFTPSGRTVTTLAHGELPREPAAAETDRPAPEQGLGTGVERVLLPTSSPLVSFRVLFETGAADDPEGKAGLAHVTARLLANGGTRQRSYEEIVDALYPMAASVGFQVDKEMTVFSGTVHRDNVDAFYEILRQMLLEPAFDEKDLERVKADTVAFLDVGLRRTDEEELGKEVLYLEIYGDHPYGHHDAGTISSVQSITVDDVRRHHRENYLTTSLVLGVAGGFDEALPPRVARDLAEGLLVNLVHRSEDNRFRAPPTDPEQLTENRLTLVQKTMTGTGIHLGFPIEVNRSHPDWPALWLVRSWLGEHRSENSHLYQRLRELRGLNYGDYAYIEYFPRGSQQFQPDPNLARRSQIFQIWLRPVEPQNGPFALKVALYELRKLIAEGMSPAAFEATRRYLTKYSNLLVQSQDRRLGYALDQKFYGLDADFAAFVQEGLAALTLDDVNRVIRQHLRGDKLQMVVVTEDVDAFRDALLGGEVTAPSYATPPSAELTAEDEVIRSLPLELLPENVRVVPVAEVFQ